MYATQEQDEMTIYVQETVNRQADNLKIVTVVTTE